MRLVYPSILSHLRSLSCLRKKKIDVDEAVSMATHQVDIIEIILGFLSQNRIMLLRRVCVAWKEAAMNTIIPPSNIYICNVKRYNAMRVMTAALPNLQQIILSTLGYRHKYNNGEDPDEERAAE